MLEQDRDSGSGQYTGQDTLIGVGQLTCEDRLGHFWIRTEIQWIRTVIRQVRTPIGVGQLMWCQDSYRGQVRTL